MVRAWVTVGCAFLVLLAACGVARAAEQAPPEDVLKARGLTRVGRIYLLEVDVKLPEAMRRFMAAKRAADDDSAKRAALEREVRRAKAAVAELNVRLGNISQRQLNVKKKDVFEHNRLVAEQNLTVSQLHEAEKYAADREADLAKLSGEPQDKYSAVVLEVSDQMEATARRYEELAADDAVTGAIKALDDRDPAKVTLGPSAQFKQQLVFVRNQRGKVATGVVKFKFDTGTPHVMVELNGAVREEMVLDTGASYVSISWSVASRLGLSPGTNDPTVKTIIANGKTEDAKLMTLRSVRLGQFTAENVPCIVSPASAGDTPLLLGGSFLRNFVYRMDMTARELHMTQLSAKPEAPATPVAVVTGPATSQPAGPKAEAGFTPLFNGRDLTGWTYGSGDRGEDKTGAGYQVRDGILFCTNEDGGNLFTEKEYGDFVLRFEFKLTENANNGIGIRTPPSGDPAYVGMEIQVLDDDGKEYRDKAGHSKLRSNQLHGSVYDVVAARPGYLKPVGEWNNEEIRAEGRRITVTLNGSVILSADLDSVKDAAVLKKHPGLKNERGRIGLLGHGSAVEFRNLRIKELGVPAAAESPAGPDDLFDGKSLAGWAGNRELWSVADGTIRGKSAGDGETYLFCARGPQKNFKLDLEFKLVSGNSGVLFRGEMTPEFGKAGGYEADLYSPNAMGKLAIERDVLFRPSAEAQGQALKPGDWNRYTIEADGERIRIWMNGQLLTDATHKGPEAGRIGLQLYGPTEVYFRNLKLRTLP